MIPLLAVAILVLLAGPVAAARADAGVSYSSSGLLVTSGEPFITLKVTRTSGDLVVTSRRLPFSSFGSLAAGPGCRKTQDGQDQEVRCSVPSGTPQVATFDLGSGDETVDLTGLDASLGVVDAFVTAGDGNDNISTNDGFDAVDGGEGSDRINGFGGNDDLQGGGGNDTLRGGAGADQVRGGIGDDTLSGGAGDDALDGGEGVDTLTYASLVTDAQVTADIGSAATATVASPTGEALETDSLAGFENLVGADLGDVLRGTNGVNTIDGGRGNDTIHGLDEFTTGDTLIGGDGADQIFGGAGPDNLKGGTGDDMLDGGPSGDTLDGEGDADNVIGRTGADKVLARDAVADTISCGDSKDSVTADLRDTIPTDCETVDQGAIKEGPNVRLPTRPLLLRADGSVRVRLACPRDLKIRCAGRLSLDRAPRRARISSLSARYSIAPGRRRTVVIRTSRAERARLRTVVRLVSVERGEHGAKTTVATLRLRR